VGVHAAAGHAPAAAPPALLTPVSAPAGAPAGGPGPEGAGTGVHDGDELDGSERPIANALAIVRQAGRAP
jgi:hypothetical protein